MANAALSSEHSNETLSSSDVKSKRTQGEEPVKLHDHGMDTTRYAVRYAEHGAGPWRMTGSPVEDSPTYNMPAGIVGIVYAAQVNSKLAAGDVAGAQESARLARIWTWVGFAVFIAWPSVYVLTACLVPTALAIPSTDSVVHGYRIALTTPFSPSSIV